MDECIAFIGGGNMAQALIGGLLAAGQPAAQVLVVEPAEAQRSLLSQRFGLAPLAQAGPGLAAARRVVWAVKPQVFEQAAAPCAAYIGQALQISVMAGVRCARISAASGSAAVVRAMPNTPALIGQGIAGLYAVPGVDAAGREAAQALFAPTGQTVWVAREDDLDAVTALSGSGPAYVFYFIEAMQQAGTEMGLDAATARRLAEATFAGAAALSQRSALAPAALREQVTSPGGTTQAALAALQADGVQAAFVRALHAARARAAVLGGAATTPAAPAAPTP
jgi:pyrroline-5-carboxylate reductase